MLPIEKDNQELEAFYNTTYQDSRKANENRWKDFKKSEYERTYQKEKAIWQTYNTILQQEMSAERDGDNRTSCPLKQYLLFESNWDLEKYDLAPYVNWLNQDVTAKQQEILAQRHQNYDSKLIHETDHKVILKFIAEYKAKYDVWSEVYHTIYGDKLITSDRKIPIKEEDTKSAKKGFTLARQVIAIMLLNEQRKINRSQDYINIEEFIEFLTGKDLDNIKKTRKKYDSANGLMKTSKKENLKDYEFIRTFFKSLELQDIVKKIDQKIKKINALNDK